MRFRVAFVGALLLCAASAFNAVIQEFVLTGTLVEDGTLSADKVFTLMVGGTNSPFDKKPSADNKTLTLIYKGDIMHLEAVQEPWDFDIHTKDDIFKFRVVPDFIKVGVRYAPKAQIKGNTLTSAAPVTTVSIPPTTVKPTVKPASTTTEEPTTGVHNSSTHESSEEEMVEHLERMLKHPRIPVGPGPVIPHFGVPLEPELERILKHPRIPLGPGPVRPHKVEPVDVETESEDSNRKRRSLFDESDEELEEKRVKEVKGKPLPKETPAALPPVEVVVSYIVLDEPGNPAAVWAAVIEGLILLALLACCCYTFVISPRQRRLADAFKAPGNPDYSVSYDNQTYSSRIEQPGGITGLPPPNSYQMKSMGGGVGNAAPQPRYDGNLVNVPLS